ncbi:hypothetical protein [Kitasatospora griseola]|uniref:hypothetical protein n=1 Tax=Kitasatospora griseola TaxID=2064 RepID=UPI00344AA285
MDRRTDAEQATAGPGSYFSPPISGAETYVHAQYDQAVQQALMVDRAEPVEWHAYDHTDGTLGIAYLFRPYDPEPMADGRLPLTASADAWHGHGCELRWTEGSGWSWTPLDEHFDPLWTATEPLPLPELADPDGVAAAVLLLLDGEDDFETSAREWEHTVFQTKVLRAQRPAAHW